MDSFKQVSWLQFLPTCSCLEIFSGAKPSVKTLPIMCLSFYCVSILSRPRSINHCYSTIFARVKLLHLHPLCVSSGSSSMRTRSTQESFWCVGHRLNVSNTSDWPSKLSLFSFVQTGHVLVFHSHWVITRRDRLLFHYLPLLAILLYTFGFFIYAMLLFPCQNSFDYTAAFCGYACFYSSTIIVAYESLVHEALPIILVGLFSVGLLLRFIIQKRQRGQIINQRKLWKMTIQLLTISTLYFATNFPYTINPIATFIFGTTPISDDVQRILLNYLSAVLPIALPYVCLGLLPNIRQKMKCYKRQTNRVGPTLALVSKQQEPVRSGIWRLELTTISHHFPGRLYPETPGCFLSLSFRIRFDE